MDFLEMLKNDLTGREDKTAAATTPEQRLRYTETMSAICAAGALFCAALGGWAWIGAGVLGLVAARKLQIALKKRGIL